MRKNERSQMTPMRRILSSVAELGVVVGVVYWVVAWSPEILLNHFLSALYVVVIYALSVYVQYRRLPRTPDRERIRLRLIWMTGPALCLTVFLMLFLVFALYGTACGATKELFYLASQEGVPPECVPLWTKAYVTHMKSDLLKTLLLAATLALRYADNLLMLTRAWNEPREQ
jgi:Na+/melibiose symporter-like transporter